MGTGRDYAFSKIDSIKRDWTTDYVHIKIYTNMHMIEIAIQWRKIKDVYLYLNHVNKFIFKEKYYFIFEICSMEFQIEIVISYNYTTK